MCGIIGWKISAKLRCPCRINNMIVVKKIRTSHIFLFNNAFVFIYKYLEVTDAFQQYAMSTSITPNWTTTGQQHHIKIHVIYVCYGATEFSFSNYNVHTHERTSWHREYLKPFRTFVLNIKYYALESSGDSPASCFSI